MHKKSKIPKDEIWNIYAPEQMIQLLREMCTF